MPAPTTGIGAVLGYLVTGTGDGDKGITDTIAASVLNATNVWDSFLKTYDSGNSAGFATTGRLSEAAYYYTLQTIATSYLTMKIGNVGAQPGSKLVPLLISKARGLQQISAAGLARFEEWCKSESAAHGANVFNYIANTAELQQGPTGAATDFCDSVGADFDTSTIPASYFGKIIDYGDAGYKLRDVSARLLSRKAEYLDAKAPHVGQYYQQMGNVASELSTRIVELYESYISVQKVQKAVFEASA
jgi:hypothetical protein